MTPPALPIPNVADPLWLGKFLDQVLTVAATCLGPNAPDRQYVAPASAPADCHQLTVACVRLRPSQAPTSSQVEARRNFHVVTIADVEVRYWECTPTFVNEDIPPAADLDVSGKSLANAGQALWFGLLAATIDGSLFPTQHRPPVVWRSAEQVSPQAGYAGWRITMEVSLA